MTYFPPIPDPLWVDEEYEEDDWILESIRRPPGIAIFYYESLITRIK